MNRYFEIKQTEEGLRTGKLVVNGLELRTPLLVHSENVIRYLRPEQVRATNTKALYYDPIVLAKELGKRDLADLPDLHRVLGWQGVLFTTSGATEIGKLAKPRGYKANGVNFRLPNQGQLISLSPKKAIQLQEQSGADITEQLYRDVNYYAPVDDLAAAVELTGRWHSANQNELFPITGGGLEKLHRQSVDSVTGQQPFGYFVTQTEQIDSLAEIKRNLAAIIKLLPFESLRVTKTKANFEQLITVIRSGIDVVYSDVAVHEAVMGNALVDKGMRLDFTRDSFSDDWKTIDSGCQCPVCTSRYSRAYLHYLARTNSPQYTSVISEHNLFWLNQFVANLSSKIN